MATTDDRDVGSIDTAQPVPRAEGDDIVVIPGGPDDPGRSRRVGAMLALGGLVVALLGAAAIAVVARRTNSTPVVRTTSPTSAPAKPIVAKVHPTVTAPRRATHPSAAVTTVPGTLPRPAVTPGSGAPLAAATVPPPPPTTAAPPKQYGASALTWTAPATLTVASGKTATLAVIAHNGTDGTVTLPHPLSCTPRLDHGEMCTEMVQPIGAGQSASAQYTIDAHGIPAGHYSLRIEGVLTVAVTVT